MSLFILPGRRKRELFHVEPTSVPYVGAFGISQPSVREKTLRRMFMRFRTRFL